MTAAMAPASQAAAPQAIRPAPVQLHIRLIDGAAFRSQSLDHQEFGSWASHYEFAEIPQDEIWVDERVNKIDLHFFLLNAEAYLGAIKAGYGEEESADYGLAVEETARTSSGIGGGDHPQHEEILPQIYVEEGPFQTIQRDGETLQVWLVNGTQVRGSSKTDFVEGGHAFVYPWIPPDEIWIEQDVAEAERPFILLHEVTERSLMKHDLLGYDEAHQQASKVELAARQEAQKGAKYYEVQRPLALTVLPEADLIRANTQAQELATAAERTDTEPSEAQKKAENFRKGKFTWNGLTIAIENPRGSIRSGVDKDGKPWSVRMKHHYGYILRTESEADGDAIDVFIGPSLNSTLVFIVDQLKDDGSFDEHKCLLAFNTATEAKEGYLSCYAYGWRGLGDLHVLSLEEFKEWLQAGDSSQALELPSADLIRHKDWGCTEPPCEGALLQNADRKIRQKAVATVDGLAIDPQGGVEPTDLQKAEKADLITLPDGVSGTNCSSCRFYVPIRDVGHCRHPDVEQMVNGRMCCIFWDREGTYRAWKDSHQTKGGNVFGMEPVRAQPTHYITEPRGDESGTLAPPRPAPLKAMSAYNNATGGALVPPPAQGSALSLRRKYGRTRSLVGSKALQPPQVSPSSVGRAPLTVQSGQGGEHPAPAPHHAQPSPTPSRHSTPSSAGKAPSPKTSGPTPAQRAPTREKLPQPEHPTPHTPTSAPRRTAPPPTGLPETEENEPYIDLDDEEEGITLQGEPEAESLEMRRETPTVPPPRERPPRPTAPTVSPHQREQQPPATPTQESQEFEGAFDEDALDRPENYDSLAEYVNDTMSQLNRERELTEAERRAAIDQAETRWFEARGNQPRRRSAEQEAFRSQLELPSAEMVDPSRFREEQEYLDAVAEDLWAQWRQQGHQSQPPQDEMERILRQAEGAWSGVDYNPEGQETPGVTEGVREGEQRFSPETLSEEDAYVNRIMELALRNRRQIDPNFEPTPEQLAAMEENTRRSYRQSYTEEPARETPPTAPLTGTAPPEEAPHREGDYPIANTSRREITAVRKAVERYWPGHTEQDVIRLVGVPPQGARFYVDDAGGDRVTVTLRGRGFQAQRTIHLAERTIHNDSFFIEPEYQKEGLGTSIFGEQVRQAVAAGFGKIETLAGRSERMNGYYTWPRLGYDTDLPANYLSRLPTALASARRVSDLMMTPEGREWWKNNGIMMNMTFDLAEGSRSRQILSAYLEEKARRRST